MSVLRLFPAPQQVMALEGLYLSLGLHRRAQMTVYANYIASLDGRISLPDAHGGQGVPSALANRRDWRLYQELAAQSDIMLTSARYFRQLAKGCAQDLLPVGFAPEYADLRDWRQAEGLPVQPDVAIVSASLEIPHTVLENLRDRKILVLTTARADERRTAQLERCGVEVLTAGDKRVEGGRLRRLLAARGYRSVYMIAGPAVHATLIAAGALDYLFLTTRHLLLGGDDFSTIMQGTLDAPVEPELVSRHLDGEGKQEFSCFRFSEQAAA